jgi:uncharacterized Zn finger protein (UPF0148 family)
MKCPLCGRELDSEKEVQIHLKLFHGAADNICPDCGSPTIHRSGCVDCPVCGWSRCG